MGGRFVVVVVWVVGFMVTIDSVVAGGAENSWVEKESDRGERGKIKNYWKIIKKQYLNEVVKKIEMLM